MCMDKARLKLNMSVNIDILYDIVTPKNSQGEGGQELLSAIVHTCKRQHTQKLYEREREKIAWDWEE